MIWVYRLLSVLATTVPLKLGYWVARQAANIQLLFDKKKVGYVANNLQTIKDHAKLDFNVNTTTRKTFHQFAHYLTEFWRLPKIGANYFDNNVTTKNLHYFDEALKKGKGVLLVSIHMSNWELAGVYLAHKGYPMNCIAQPHKTQAVTDMFVQQRAEKGMTVFNLNDGPQKTLRALKQNKAVAILGERDVTGGGVNVDFFGKESVFPQGPARLALKTGAAFLPLFTIRNEDDTFTVQFERPLTITNKNPTDKNTDVKDLTQLFAKLAESIISQHPHQWAVFFPAFNGK